ncbi:Fic family protein [Variovorax robiniae]|uniref:Fic family protein n=1 Tax=Variovorax robiniae TaxID=1836199 RepID=A0ABU8X770_9BURK
MSPKRTPYIWQKPGWPELHFDMATVGQELTDAHRMLGEIEGKAAALGLGTTSDVALDVFSGEVIATAAIEGEALSVDAVRSSVMRRLGMGSTGPSNRHVDGLVEVVNDATTRFDLPLDEDRLCRWQSALFPGGTSGIQRIAVGRYRDHEEPMQIVGGKLGRETIYYVAPPSRTVRAEMDRFLAWFADTAPAAGGTLDGVARAAVAHLWFETIHPFEDGNGRIGRAIMDMAIAQHQRKPVRLYSLSRQLLSSRKDYYDSLNQAQRGDVDVSAWVQWLARQFSAACTHTSTVIDQAIAKRRFWDQHGARVNDRQRMVLQRLLDDGDGGFDGGMNAEKYMKITKASKPTATRDLAAMVEAGQMWSIGMGRAVRYYVNMPGWTHGVERG